MSSNSAEYQRDWYHQNKHRLAQARRQRNKDEYNQRRAFVNQEKLRRGACFDCGLATTLTNLMIFEFDHRDPDSKLFNISECKGKAFAIIAEEMDKCDMVCANCHRIRTANTAGWNNRRPDETSTHEQPSLFDTEDPQ